MRLRLLVTFTKYVAASRRLNLNAPTVMESKAASLKGAREEQVRAETVGMKNHSENPGAADKSSGSCSSSRSSASLTPSSAEPRANHPTCQDYKPTALRWWFHLLLVACFAVLIGLTEYAIRTLDMYAADYGDLASQLMRARAIGETSRCHESLTVASSSRVPGLLNVRQVLTTVYLSSLASPPAAGATTSMSKGESSLATSTPSTMTTGEQTSSRPSSTGTGLTMSATSLLGTGFLVDGKTTSTLKSPVSPTSPTSDPGGDVGDSEKTFTPSSAPTILPSYSTDGYLQDSDTTKAVTAGWTSYLFEDKTTITPYPSAPVASVTVGIVKQTTTLPPSEVTSERTSTGYDGRVSTETYLWQTGGDTSISELTVTMDDANLGLSSVQETDIDSGRVNVVQTTLEASRPGATLIAQPSVVETIIGGETQIGETSYTDSQGVVRISSYSTILGGKPTLSTIAVLMTTSIAPGDTLVTLEVIRATTVAGTPTSSTFWTVQATSAPAGESLVTSPTVFPVTRGGSTEFLSTTYTDAQGHLHTSSYATVVGGTAGTETLWTVIAVPTPTQGTGSWSTGQAVSVVVIGTSPSEYALGTFFPTVVAALLSFALKLISINARLMQPFHALATADKRNGVSFESSMFLRFYSWSGSLSFTRALWFRQPVVAISDVLVLLGGLLAPFAAETVSVYKSDDACESFCYGTLGVTLVPGRVLQSLMSAVAVLLLALIVLLSVRRWETGVSQNPWSIAGISSLCLDSNLRRVMMRLPRSSSGSVEESAIMKALAGTSFAIGDISTSSSPYSGIGNCGHGIVIFESDSPDESARKQEAAEVSTHTSKNMQPFVLLTWWARCIQIFIFSSILVIIAYYENTGEDTGFERFLDGQDFGVQFFFTALGVLLGYCMESMFRCKWAQKEPSKCFLD